MSALAELHIESEKQIGRVAVSASAAPAPITPTVLQALESPEEFPALGEAVFPGDRITIAVQGDPELAWPVVSELLGYLNRHGVRYEDLAVLLPPGWEATQREWSAWLQSETATEVTTMVHDPDDPRGLAFLAVAEDGSPIVFARQLLDADMVIPVREAAPLSTTDWERELFPIFSDLATQRRFRQSIATATDQQWQQRAKWIAEANQQLGILFEVFIVPGNANTIREVVAGSRQAALLAARRFLDQIWVRELAEPVELIVATPRETDDPINQRELLRCIEQLQACVADHGTLVLLGRFSGLEEVFEVEEDEDLPMPELEPDAEPLSAEDEATESDPQELREQLEEPVRQAWQDPLSQPTEEVPGMARWDNLEETLDRIRVVVSGKGFDESVETLGIGVADSLPAVQRLIDRHAECLIVQDALRCQLRIKEAIQ